MRISNSMSRIALIFFSYIALTTHLYSSDGLIVASTSASSIDSHFHVTYNSKSMPVPLNKIHQWVINIKDRDGNAVEKATILVDGGMPAHNHGLPTQPIATEIGNGNYLIEGMKFSMTGLWEMWFYIQTDTVKDEVMFVVAF